MTDRIDTLEAALREIEAWSRAYPVKVFPEMTPADFANAHRLLKAGGLTLDRLTASIIRDTVDDAGRIAREALAKAGTS